MDYKEIRKDNTYVDLSSFEERKAMGKHLSIVHTENDKGSQITVFYYTSGIDVFDKLLNNTPFYEYGLSLHLLSCENAFLFRLYSDNKRLVVCECAIWRDSIVSYIETQNKYAKFISVNRFLNILYQGTGLVGSVIKTIDGETISKLKGVKTEEAKAILYELKYLTDNDKVKEIKIYKRDWFNSENSFFIENNYKNSFEKKDITSNDSRCFIATACYNSNDCKELIVFRNFRDKYLLKSILGKVFVELYYLTSPFLVENLNSNAKEFIKTKFLDKFYKYLEKK